MELTVEYIGPRKELVGHKSLMIPHNMGTRFCPPGFGFCQFTSVPPELGDPTCLQQGGAEPKPGDLRFGWHLFKTRHFKFIAVHEGGEDTEAATQ